MFHCAVHVCGQEHQADLMRAIINSKEDIEFRIVHRSSKSATAVWGLGFMPHMVYDLQYILIVQYVLPNGFCTYIPEDDS